MIVEHSSRITYALRDMNLEQIDLGYSLKNILIPSSKQYMKCLIEKVASFIRRIRWKAYFFDHPDSSNSTDNYNFKSDSVPLNLMVLFHLKTISMKW